ncbi:hypothetical protein [Caballeronia hypogeia]|uniref:hypothetical protein n=1 Tax=Caballeronia hypogeia TaxID=1777140 RepID=UPI001E285883|nr:hypothetical protein [Caballeronia hypogeia]
MSSRVRLVVFTTIARLALAAPFDRGALVLLAAGFAAGFAVALMPGRGFGAIAAFDAFTAVAAFVTMGDDAARGASEEEDLGNAALRRAGRADPEDVTLGSSQKLRSQGTTTGCGRQKEIASRNRIGRETAGRDERPCVKSATPCRGVRGVSKRSTRASRP